jgi:hypothetical protein
VSPSAPPPPSTLWVIDRIEAGWATLCPAEPPEPQGGAELTLPAALLPAGAREGQALRLALTLDLEATQRLKGALSARVSALAAGDDGGDFSL